MSVLNQTGGYNVSNKYRVIPTGDLVAELEKHGMKLTKIVETRVNKASKAGFQKHMLRFSHTAFTDLQQVGEYRPEIVLVNSYDGSCSFRLMLGIYRLVCSNGLVVGDSFESYRVKHVGNPMPGILDAIKKITESLPKVAAEIQAMQTRVLYGTEIESFSRQACDLILPENKISAEYRYVTRVRRMADTDNTLWNIFNRAQEAALRGGLKYLANVKHIDDNGIITESIEKRTTRAIKSIDRVVEINRSLWNLAERFAA